MLAYSTKNFSFEELIAIATPAGHISPGECVPLNLIAVVFPDFFRNIAAIQVFECVYFKFGQSGNSLSGLMTSTVKAGDASV